jgi:transposase
LSVGWSLRDPTAVATWPNEATGSGLDEVRGFAARVRRDPNAVDAASRRARSNGQTERHVNKLKLLKRAMYGRGRSSPAATASRRLI